MAIPADKVINEDVTLVEHGVDSLMAVEVRSFFLKELNVDIPVLKILGGSSVKGLLEEVLKLLSTSIIDFAALEIGAPPKDSSAKPSTLAMPLTKPIDPPALPVVKAGSSEDLSSSNSTTDEASPEETPPESNIGADTPLETPLETPGLKLSSSTSNLLTAEKLLTLEKLLDSTNRSNPSGVTRKETITAMSYGQKGFWFLNDYLLNKRVFNMGVMMKLTGVIRPKSLEEAVRMVARRHEILRTRFLWSGEGDERRPMQAITPTPAIKLETKQISSEAEAETEFQSLNNHTYDLSNGETARVVLLSLSEQEHFLMAGMHHIYLDGYSFSLYFKDLETAYITKRLSPLPADSQYRTFAIQQIQSHESGAFDETIDYYRKTLPNGFEPISLLPFAKSNTRQSVNSYSQSEISLRLEPTFADKVRQLARQNRCTSFHVYLGALQVLLFRLLPDTSDILIGMGDANRGDKKFIGSIGFFLNLLPLYFRRSKAGAKVSSIIQETRETAYGALKHSHLPLGVLLDELNVPRSNQYSPLFQVFMDYRQVQQEQSSWGGCKVSGEKWHDAGTGYDIALEVTEFNADCSLSLRLQNSLYSDESTDMLLRSYVNVLEFMVGPSDKLVDEIPA